MSTLAFVIAVGSLKGLVEDGGLIFYELRQWILWK